MTRHAEFAAEKLTLLKSPAPRILGMSIFVFLVRAYIYNSVCTCIYIYIHMCTHVYTVYWLFMILKYADDSYQQKFSQIGLWTPSKIATPKSRRDWDRLRCRCPGVLLVFESVKSCAASDWCFAAFLRPKHGIPLKLFQTLLYPNNWPSSGPTFNTLYAINMLYCECMTLKLWRIAITFNHPYHHTHSSTI
jgi:hypothetical protein